MITDLTRLALRLIMAGALFVLVAILVMQGYETSRQARIEARAHELVLPDYQTYTSPNDYSLPPFKADDYTVVNPPPVQTAKKLSVANNRPAIPVWSVGAAQAYARARVAASQWQCLAALWNRESGWNYHAENTASGAYGIPQSLPGSKMSTFGSDWRDNYQTQIRWGLDYIRAVYGTPCGAWAHSQGYGWY